MANKRLDVQEVSEMKEMVKQGITPEEISKHFGIAISSVHNWKNKFKQEGITFPSVKGRPKPDAPKIAAPVKSRVQPGTKTVPNKSVIGVVAQAQPLKLIVNGVSIQIEASARSVDISGEAIKIDF